MIVHSAGLVERIKHVERESASAILGRESFFYDFAVTPTCPPSKRLNIRSGTMNPGTRWFWIMSDGFIESVTCDFEDTTQTGMNCNFTNSRWFLPILLCYYGEWAAYHAVEDQPQVFYNVIADEVETFQEAEAEIDGFLNGMPDPDPTWGSIGGWYYYRFPLTGVVLKNNGIVGSDGQIEPIDRINRGRSYLYRDIRSRMGLTV